MPIFATGLPTLGPVHNAQQCCFMQAKGYIHKDTLDKWLNADEAEHIPGLFALHVASLVAKDAGPLYAWLTALGEDVEVLTPEDRLYLEYGKKMMRKKIHAEEAAEAEKQLRRKLK